MNVSETIKSKLIASLAPENISLINESAKHAGHAGSPNTGNSHFALVIVSSQFEHKSLKQRHSMVYAALDGMIGNEIHALSIKALTPAEVGKL